MTVPAADIYRYLEDVNAIGCILEDEIQGIDKDTDKIKIYRAGYKEGAVVPRTIIIRNDRIIKFYNTFCFKACASERIPSVKGFRERFIEISIYMDELKKAVEEADQSVKSLLAISYYSNPRKTTPRLITNGWSIQELPF